MRIIRSGAALVFLLSATLAVHAAGLGKLTVNSALGQSLNAEIDLVALQPGESDTLSARVASPEAFRDAHVEYTASMRLLRFAVDKRPNGSPFLKVTSIAPINEPFIDVLVEVSWPAGRLQREYPILLDPPGYAQQRPNAPSVAAAPAPAPIPAPTVAPAPAPAPVEAPAPTAPVTQNETPPAAAPAAPPSPAEPSSGPSARAELPASQAPPAAVATDTYGPIEKGETLSKIAGEVKPADVSLEQTLVALYRQNEAAFAGKNMNRLKTGQILKVPTSDEISAITQADARKEIHTQVQDWNSYRDQLASGVASTPSAAAAPNVASGRIGSAAVAPPSVPPPASQDTLRLSKSDTGAKAGGGGARNGADRLAAAQEELTAKDKALKESQSRVADLEKQIRDMQRLLDLKSAAPATTPGKMAAATPPAPTPVPPAPAKAAEPTKAPEPAKTEPAKPTEPVKAAAEPTKPAEPTKADTTPANPPVASTEPPKTTTPPPDTKKPAPKVVPPPEKGMMDELLDNPAILAGGVGAVALILIGGFIFSRRRRNRFDEGPTSAMTSAFPSDLKPGANTGKPASGGLVDTGNSSFLTDFDKTGPGTIDTDEVDPVAEAEVYIAYGRDAQAEEILKEAMARDRNRHEIALKLLEIYHARKSATAFETVAKELRSAVGEDSPLWQKAAAMGAQIDPTNPLYGSAAAGTATFTAMAPTPPAAAPAKPDLDFDLAGSSSASHNEAPAPAPSFDLDLDSSKSVGSGHDSGSSGLDFDLAPSGTAARPPMDMPAETPKEEKDASFDFDLSGLDLGSSSKPAAASHAPAHTDSGSLELSDLSLDSPAAGGDSDGAGTKLELAKAYLEIGDKDGAREILQEVAKEGTSSQKDEANRLIASL